MADNTERWKQLCALAAVEQDPQRLLELAQEINRLLDERGREWELPKGGTVQ